MWRLRVMGDSSPNLRKAEVCHHWDDHLGKRLKGKES